MSEHKYRNEYEREETQKYEGTYTPEEIELNKKLYEECLKEQIDFAVVEELLKQGADPLGGTELYGWELIENIYGEVIFELNCNNRTESLPKLTELFLNYGMNIDKPRIPYDGLDSINPLWNLSFVMDENAIFTMKTLLDYGISSESFAECWDHSISDYFHVECGDPQNDEYWKNACTLTFRLLLLGASYDYILRDDEGLREFICCDFNTYDLHNFRNFDGYEYSFDTSHCEERPELYGSIVRIYEKATGAEVWKIGVGIAGRELLARMVNKKK